MEEVLEASLVVGIAGTVEVVEADEAGWLGLDEVLSLSVQVVDELETGDSGVVVVPGTTGFVEVELESELDSVVGFGGTEVVETELE